MPRCALGEGATWSAARHALLWTDINGCRLWSYEPATQRVSHWALPGRLGSFALTADGQRLLAAFEHELAWLDLHSGEVTPLARFDQGLPTRANDGRCDRHGHFLFGTLDEERGPQAQGRWWRYSAQGELHALDLPPVCIPNGLALGPDGTRLYFCDSTEQRIRCSGYDAASGGITHPQVFAPVHAGEPDGATVDAQGHYWSAHWGAGCVLGYQSDGQVMARVQLPVSQPSCVAFGGPGLQTLYITTASVGLSDAQMAQQADAGSLYAVQLPWAGLPEPLYGQLP
jgi:L-arabinonolactonase